MVSKMLIVYCYSIFVLLTIFYVKTRNEPRLENYFAGRKNLDIVCGKVIGPEDDPRYKAARKGLTLKWNFDKRCFYLNEGFNLVVQ